MNINGEDLDGVHGCVSYLKGLWRGEKPGPLGRVAVVGGGNAAVEAARASIRAGAGAVKLIYRRTRKEMPADPHEVEQALEEGVELIDLTVPVAFEGKDGRLARIKCVKMKLGSMDASGRRRPVEIEGSDYYMDADTVIVSIGQRADYPEEIAKNIDRSPSGTLKIKNGGETSVPGVFASETLSPDPLPLSRPWPQGEGRPGRLSVISGRERAISWRARTGLNEEHTIRYQRVCQKRAGTPPPTGPSPKG